MIIAIIVAITTGFIVYFMYQNEKQKPTQSLTELRPITNNSFSKINGTLEAEHEGIMNALDSVYNLSKNHYDTEKRMFIQGQEKLCSGHSDVTGMWTEHDNAHSNLLEQINQLKQQFINHIENYDKPHFHWTS